MRTRLSIIPILVLLPATSIAPAAEPEPTPEQVKTAVTKSLALLDKSANEYTKHRDCFSCHHQALPLVALTTAKARGFEVSDKTLEKQVAHTHKHLGSNRDNYKKGQGQGGQVDSAGYALLALEVGGAKPDATTAAVAEYLLLRDADRDTWRVSANRPPTEASLFTAAYVALRGLRTYGTPEQVERIEERTAKERKWLLATPAKDTEDRVFRLGALKLAGADAIDVKAAADELRKAQRDDGGWSQTDALDSDAYATGTALWMLHEAGGLAVTDEAYRRGVAFLVGSQREDGSWYVKTRSKPFQVYFESGFPYEKDQWISICATSWATAALALTVQNPRKDGDPKKPPDDGKRRAPAVLAPGEGAAAVAFTQVRSYVLAKDGNKNTIMVLDNAPGKEPATRYVPLEELAKDNQITVAQTVLPLRQAIIVGSFPYRQQLEEFQRKLGLNKLDDVLTDLSGETAEGDDKTRLPAFRFLGVDLERRPVNADGKPLTGRDGKPLPWEEVKLSETYRPLVLQNGKRFEPDDDALTKVSFAGLVMPRLALMRSGQYPPVERRLAALQKTLDRLKADATALPEHCLIRLIDVDVGTGDIYRYRFRVRMANPNYKRTDVASPELAKSDTPLVSAWFEIPQLVAVPPEYHVYAVDQRELEKKYEGQNKDVRYDANRQAVFQIHKWLQYTSPGGPTCFPVGEWAVAERVIVYRGEYVGRRQRVEVPYWNTVQERFVLAADKSGQGAPKKGIPVDFTPLESDPMILVDFEGGNLSYTRIGGTKDEKPQQVRVAERAGYETLIVSPDGKLLSRTSWTDANHKERVERLDTWRRRIKEVKEGTSTGDPKNPFNRP